MILFSCARYMLPMAFKGFSWIRTRFEFAAIRINKVAQNFSSKLSFETSDIRSVPQALVLRHC